MTVILALTAAGIWMLSSADAPQSASWAAYQGNEDLGVKDRWRRFKGFWKKALGPPKYKSFAAVNGTMVNGTAVNGTAVNGTSVLAVNSSTQPPVEQVQGGIVIRKRKIKIGKKGKENQYSYNAAQMVTVNDGKAANGPVPTTLASGTQQTVNVTSTSVTNMTSTNNASSTVGQNGTAPTAVPQAAIPKPEDIIQEAEIQALLSKYESKAKSAKAGIDPRTPGYLRFNLINNLAFSISRLDRRIRFRFFGPGNKQIMERYFEERPGTMRALLKYCWKSGKEGMSTADQARFKKEMQREKAWFKGAKGLKKSAKMTKKTQKKKTVKKVSKKTKEAGKKNSKKTKKTMKKVSTKSKKTVKKTKKSQKKTQKSSVDGTATLLQRIKQKRDAAIKTAKRRVIACKCAVFGVNGKKGKKPKAGKPFEKVSRMQVGKVTVQHGVKRDIKGRLMETHTLADSKGNKHMVAKGVDPAGRSVYINREVKIAKQKLKEGKLSKAEQKKLQVRLVKLETQLKTMKKSKKTSSKKTTKKTKKTKKLSKTERKALKKRTVELKKQLKDSKLSKEKRATIKKDLKKIEKQLKSSKTKKISKVTKKSVKKSSKKTSKKSSKKSVKKSSKKSVKKSKITSSKKSKSGKSSKARHDARKKVKALKEQLKDEKLDADRRKVLEKELKDAEKALKKN